MAPKKEDFQKNFAKVITKAWKDPAYKRKLLSNPDAVLKNEGLDIPKGMHVEFHEDTNKVMHFTLPRRPEGHLSDEQLQNIAAAGSPHTMLF
jgi:hypothetical protein